MSADSVMRRGRLASERLMIDSVIVTRRLSHVTNADTGQIVWTYSTLYNGKCRIQQRTMFDRPRNVGESFELMLAVEVQLPMSATGIKADDLITVMVAGNDPDLVGRVFVVRGLNHRTFTTARRYQALEINS